MQGNICWKGRTDILLEMSQKKLEEGWQKI